MLMCICIGYAQDVDLQGFFLIVGKSMMGKSSTANSLFNEPVAQVTSFQQDTAQPQAFKRVALGFEFTVIDTPGLLDGDTINTAVRSASDCLPSGRFIAARLQLALMLACEAIVLRHTVREFQFTVTDTLGLPDSGNFNTAVRLLFHHLLVL